MAQTNPTLRVGALLWLALAACKPAPAESPDSAPSPDAAVVAAPSARPAGWVPPEDPAAIRPANRGAIVFLHAPWCQWCEVMQHEVLSDESVERHLKANFDFGDVDVDQAPAWMDLPGIQGLPSLVFFDARGRHVLTKSGYRSKAELQLLVDAIVEKLEEGMEPYPPARRSRLPKTPISPTEAARLLGQLEGQAFIKVNSNDGGFGSPSRHPHPHLLEALLRWVEAGGSPRVRTWIDLTVDNSLRGTSPRLRGEPAADMDFDGAELARLATEGPNGGARWREGVERLPTADPYLGIQDPVDRGVFRYAAGPGWYHPHFERLAIDNLAWVLLLRRLGREDEAVSVERYLRSTFFRDARVAATQKSDPFYYRLTAEERRDVRPPEVFEFFPLHVQAMAARVDPSRCSVLISTLAADRWPKASWTASAEDASAPDAPPDWVGEALVALAECGAADRAAELARVATKEWEGGLPRSPRLAVLASGICAAEPSLCGRALAAISTMRLDPKYPPPFAAIARHAAVEPQP